MSILHSRAGRRSPMLLISDCTDLRCSSFQIVQISASLFFATAILASPGMMLIPGGIPGTLGVPGTLSFLGTLGFFFSSIDECPFFPVLRSSTKWSDTLVWFRLVDFDVHASQRGPTKDKTTAAIVRWEAWWPFPSETPLWALRARQSLQWTFSKTFLEGHVAEDQRFHTHPKIPENVHQPLFDVVCLGQCPLRILLEICRSEDITIHQSSDVRLELRSVSGETWRNQRKWT